MTANQNRCPGSGRAVRTSRCVPLTAAPEQPALGFARAKSASSRRPSLRSLPCLEKVLLLQSQRVCSRLTPRSCSVLAVLTEIPNSLRVACEQSERIQEILLRGGERLQNESLLTGKFVCMTTRLGKPDRRIRWKHNKRVSLLLCSAAAVSYLPSCIPGTCDKFVGDKATLLFSPLCLPVVLPSFDAIMKILSALMVIQNINKPVAVSLSLET